MNSKKDKKVIIDNFFSEGGSAMIIIGTDLVTSKQALEIANEHENIYASIGIHPCDVEGLDLLETMKTLEQLYLENTEKIVAIGETGLDYHWPEKDAEKLEQEGKLKDKAEYIKKRKELQAVFFKAQILFAQSYNLPFIIHNRDSKNDVLKIIKEMNYKNFIFHCYSEDYEYAKEVLDFAPDCYLSFSGTVTFKNALPIQETATNIPEKNILAETDCPFLTPVPLRGKEENEPKFTRYIIQKIAELRGISEKEVETFTDTNAKRVFSLDTK